ncbi:protein arginine N-methyltransferase 7 [Tetranychus urticae]|uniref:Protein arginine N-methyltransferase n=1 Tax=Tetranychus urticae TaxID=32264 RepID=T1KXD3_TETUR|nr:protein arginine N-methyltransferase 7 [Tetranychus urticae]
MTSNRLVSTQKFNPLTNNLELTNLTEDHDFMQEISLSGYGEMLWDQERNILYNKAIKKYVERLMSIKKPTEKIRVIDIGTGTGLLSMMVCREFGSNLNRVAVTAFECFSPMAECAEKVIKRNNFDKTITVINSRSDEVDPFDPDERADLIVSEIFDTELIGEGALRVFKVALTEQCKLNPLVIPHKARIWVQLVKSSWLNNGHCLAPKGIFIDGKKLNIEIPKSIINCYGSNHLHDLQANQLEVGKDIELISDPMIAFVFDFSKSDSLKYDEQKTLKFILKNSLNSEFVNIVFWWDLFMDDESEYVLSCAPYWAHPAKDIIGTKNRIPWRDHWMQAIYYLPAYHEPFKMNSNEIFELYCNHDEFSFWFDVGSRKQSDSSNFCSCGIHNDLSRNRIRMMADERVLSVIYPPVFIEIFGKRDLNILFLGDASLIPVLLGKDLHESGKVYVINRGQMVNKRFYEEFGRTNEIMDRLVIADDISDIEQIQFDLIIAEPFFNSIILPWDAFHFWYLIGDMAERGMVTIKTKIYPSKGRVVMLPVAFDNLWKIKAELRNVEGFDLADFDSLLEKARELCDSPIESKSLWEYPCKALSDKPITLFDFDFRDERVTTRSRYNFRKIMQIGNSNEYNNIGLAFWTEYDFGDKKLSTGPVEKIICDQYIEWCKNWKQGMAILHSRFADEVFNKDALIDLEIEYDCSSGVMNLKSRLIKESEETGRDSLYSCNKFYL